MAKRHSGWIGVDLDGTLAEHYWPQKRQYDPMIIGDPVIPMLRRVARLIDEGYEVRVMTARVGPHGSAPGYGEEHTQRVRAEIANWTRMRHLGRALEATCVKDYNMIALYDDRAVRIKFNEGVPCCEHADYDPR